MTNLISFPARQPNLKYVVWKQQVLSLSCEVWSLWLQSVPSDLPSASQVI